MEYIIIALLIVLIFLTILSLFKNINEGNITERLSKLEIEMIKELGLFKEDLNQNLKKDFTELNEQVEKRLLLINEKVSERLDQNFEKTNKTFISIVERLSKIDEAQKKIDGLSNDIVSLQSILTDKKSRGIFGEVTLKHVLSSVFGEKNDAVYQLQYPLPNGTIVDSILFAPEPLGTVAIDSKFPLEHYEQMVNKKLSKEERDLAEKAFKQDMKRHIDAIHDKYIIEGITTDQAILFLPAEAIFAEINAYHQDILEYSYKKKVWITSPTTLMSTLSIIQMIIKNIERDQYTSIIHQELNKLGLEFARYKERWDKLSRSIQAVSRDAENISITTDKIQKKFESIHEVNMEQLNALEEKNHIEMK